MIRSSTSTTCVAVDPSLGLHRQRFTGQLVDDIQQLDRPAVLGDVELEVKRPHVIGPLCPQPVPWHGAIPALGRLRRFGATRSPSFRHSRWVRLRLTCQPCSNKR